MGRPADIKWVYRTIDKMRKAMPSLAIRTTFIVGYPGETEDEFQALLDFARTMRFDRLGTFKYSSELGTRAAVLGDPVTDAVKEERYQKLMEIQSGISLELNRALIGKTMDVLVEKQSGKKSEGRSYRDAPEIDGKVTIMGCIPLGEIVPVRITRANHYDLFGSVE
jgi:ribosomal protein S12 methylthiotransferase